MGSEMCIRDSREIAWAKRKRGESSPLPWVALVLTLVNTAVAYLWT